MTEKTDETLEQSGIDETSQDEDQDITLEVDELVNLKQERDGYLEQLQRSRAEFINFKRRTDQERFAVREMIGRDVLSQFLPVVDDFERALGSLPEAERESSWVSGMELIKTKLTGILDRAGVQKIDALGEPFDPKWHEAVATEPGTAGSHVTEVYQSGYKIGDTLIRPAMVKTGDPLTEESETPTFNA